MIAGRRKHRVLAVDAEPGIREWLELLLARAGYDVRSVGTGAQADDALRAWRPDVVVTDFLLPDVDGLEMLRRFCRSSVDAEVIVFSAEGTVVDAVKAGAQGYLEKPADADTVLAVVAKAAERRQLRAENERLRRQVHGPFAAVIGRSRRMRDLLELVQSVAPSDANVLIQGENGTGKELIANAIHDNSKRAREPFIKINCAAIPRDLIESELFGYRKGAFTGALTDKQGLFELAEGGSLLLDEVGSMPAYLQTKLLRVLQEREFRPIGGDRSIQVDFRLICATNVDLEVALREGRLREDLYFRINTITLKVPALRERTEDIPLLCEHFLEKYRQRHSRAVRSVSAAAYHALIRHPWPGNVRELENVIERGVLVARGVEIALQDLPEALAEERAGAVEFVVPPHRTLAEIEKMAILQTLQRTNWNKQEAAQILGLYRPTLYSKMKKHEIIDAGRSAGRRLARNRLTG